jgi:hypothetical protein
VGSVGPPRSATHLAAVDRRERARIMGASGGEAGGGLPMVMPVLRCFAGIFALHREHLFANVYRQCRLRRQRGLPAIALAPMALAVCWQLQ